MNPITSLLERIRSITPPDETIRQRIVSIVEDVLRFKLDKKDIVIRNLVVYIKTPPVIRSEIFMNKKFILESLKQEFGNKAPLDIR